MPGAGDDRELRVGKRSEHDAYVVELHLVVVGEHEERWRGDAREILGCEGRLLAVHAVELGQEDGPVLTAVWRHLAVPVA